MRCMLLLRILWWRRRRHVSMILPNEGDSTRVCTWEKIGELFLYAHISSFSPFFACSCSTGRGNILLISRRRQQSGTNIPLSLSLLPNFSKLWPRYAAKSFVWLLARLDRWSENDLFLMEWISLSISISILQRADGVSSRSNQFQTSTVRGPNDVEIVTLHMYAYSAVHVRWTGWPELHGSPTAFH